MNLVTFTLKQRPKRKLFLNHNGAFYLQVGKNLLPALDETTTSALPIVEGLSDLLNLVDKRAVRCLDPRDESREIAVIAREVQVVVVLPHQE